jgi:hypothetical protein
MSAITLARKPLSETSVAANALRWGTGGINIDGSRIGGSVPQVTQGVSDSPSSYGIASNTQQSQPSPLGRWPANLILQHKPGCRIVGHRTLPGYQINRWEDGVRFAVGGTESQDYEAVEMGESEDVPVWACMDGCPVADLDEQSGYSLSKKTMRGVGWNDSPIYSDSGDPDFDTERGFNDEGGASRFFKQTQTEDDVSAPPQDLISYLTTLISPPDQTATHLGDVDTIAWDVVALMEDASVCGLIVRGTPSEEQAAELMRILMPGAHLLLIAPEEQPTGHTGACRIEDVGFEIRDAILWAREAGGLHYVPKASRAEREAGCGFLEGKTGAEATDREEDSAGLDSPRAGAGRSAASVKNFHPTVKPIGVMERLLLDLPTDEGPIIDPFNGSGTTGLACLRTGHDYIGIEREEEYGVIATSRAMHWDTELRAGATIESDFEVPVNTGLGQGGDVMDMGDLFGWDD